MTATRQRPAAARAVLAAAVLLLVLAGAAAAVRAQAPPPACFGAASRDQLHPCHNRALRLAVVPSPHVAEGEPNAACNSFRREAGISVCTFGVLPAQATRNIALVGDSHASHWRGPLAAVAGAQGWRGLSLTRKSCPFSAATKRTPEPTRAHCIRWVKALRGLLRAHPEIDTIFVVALAGGKVVVPSGRTVLEAKVNGYRRAWTALPDTIKHIVVIRDTPRIDRTTAACIDTAITGRRPAGTACARPRGVAIGPDPQAIAARRANSPRLQVIDLTPAMCSTRLCFPVIGGALVYKDLHHLSLAFADTAHAPVDPSDRARDGGLVTISVRMPADRLQLMRDRYGDQLPDGLHALSDAELADLRAALDEAHIEQTRALDGAIDHTLRFLPWPLSGIVRRVILG